MTFGEKLKKIRNENQMTQEELAEKVLVTRTAVSKWETDKGYPSIDSLKLLSDVFHMRIDELISDADVENKRRLDEKRAKRAYIFAVLFLGISVSAALVQRFYPSVWVQSVSVLGALGYVAAAVFSKPKYKRANAKKYILTYVASRAVILLLVIGLMIHAIAAVR